MADNYTQFSFAIPLDDDEQRDWARRAIAWLESYVESEGVDENGDELEADPDIAPAIPEDAYSLGYTAEVDEDGLWIHSEESGNPEEAASLVQIFLRRFDPTGCVGFEWANTCSRPRLDEFGGGAVFITADDTKWMPTSTWLAEQFKAHDG